MRRLIFILLLFPLLIVAQNVSHHSLPDLDGNIYEIDENLEHDATLMIFWATWCKPCKLEFQDIKQLEEKLTDIDINILTVSVDSPHSLAKIKAFANSHDYDFTYLLDIEGELKTLLLVNEIPHTVIIDKQGRVVYSHVGFREGDEMVIEQEIINVIDNSKKSE
jgi:peroxiredoxin